MRILIALGLQALAVTAPAQSLVEINPTDTEAVVRYGVEALPFDSSCLVTLTDSGDSPVSTSTQATGLSRREAIFTGLSASTTYLITINCDGSIFDWVDDESFTTSAALAGGNVTTPIQFGDAPTYSSIARATLRYDDNAAMTSPTSTQNTSCASGCTINMSAPAGLQYWQWIWQTSGDATIVTSPVFPLNIGDSSPHTAKNIPTPPQAVPIPELATWESNMLSYGVTHCANFAANSDDDNFVNTFYDAPEVYRQIRDYTGDSSWDQCISDTVDSMLNAYYIPFDYRAAGWWNFTEGFRSNWEVNAHVPSKTAVEGLADRAAFCAEGDYDTYTNADSSRESAYCLIAEINTEAVGTAPSGQMAAVKNIVLDHLDQWFITKDYVLPTGSDGPAECYEKYYIQPVMVGLTARALIKYYEEVSADAAIKTALKTALDVLWVDAWQESEESMWYDNCKTLPGDAWPAKAGDDEENLLIATAYAWLWEEGEGTGYRDKADALFAGGVGPGTGDGDGAWIVGSKQFNQNYLWSFEYVTIRTP